MPTHRQATIGRVNTPSSTSHSLAAPAVTHYENFPVASWLCPPHLRPVIAAIYHFARAGDDIADEGEADATTRLAQLQAFRQQLWLAAQHTPYQGAQAAIFAPLQTHIHAWKLPVQLLDDLLSAFVQDVEKTRDGASYEDREALLDYCSRSANPVGRLLLHLYGVHDAQALAQSDAICTALQLINFWQDLSQDIPRGRHYLPDADCAQFKVSRSMLDQGKVTPAIQQLMNSEIDWARELMLQGAPLVHRVPGRLGWELRLVVQGGLCILDKVQAQQGRNLHTRLTVRKTDVPRMLWRALCMRAAP